MKNQQNNIPIQGNSYTKYRLITETCILIYKKVGFTPLQVLEEIKPYIDEVSQNKLTFIGRLDPMAEGNIHILWSGDMKEKERIQKQDKEYTVEVLLGIQTDTGDILGLIEYVTYIEFKPENLQKFVGPFVYDYPTYSSPHIKKVLKGEKVINKKQEGYIYSIESVGVKNYTKEELKEIIFNKLALCQMAGDFRLDQIAQGWNDFFENSAPMFKVVTLNVKCKRGTYMRVLARELGGLALSIIRG